MIEEHFHRLKPGWRSRAYQWLIVALLDARTLRGRVVGCRCLAGDAEIAARNGRLAFTREAA